MHKTIEPIDSWRRLWQVYMADKILVFERLLLFNWNLEWHRSTFKFTQNWSICDRGQLMEIAYYWQWETQPNRLVWSIKYNQALSINRMKFIISFVDVTKIVLQLGNSVLRFCLFESNSAINMKFHRINCENFNFNFVSVGSYAIVRKVYLELGEPLSDIIFM